MAINIELRKIREKKYDIYHGLRVLLAEGRKYGCELNQLEVRNIKTKDLVYIDILLELLQGEGYKKGCYNHLKSYNTYEGIIKELLDNDFCDDVCRLVYKIEHTGCDLVYALIYDDKIDPNDSRFDIFIINTQGERR